MKERRGGIGVIGVSGLGPVGRFFPVRGANWY